MMFAKSFFRRKSSPAEPVQISAREERRSRSFTTGRAQLRAAGSASQQGRKQFQNEDKVRLQAEDGFALVLDGHSGAQCARFVSENLGSKFGKNLTRRWKEPSMCSVSSSTSTLDGQDDDSLWEQAAKVALVKSFKDVDLEFLRGARNARDESAASAVFCAIRLSRVVVASVGRCSALYIRADGSTARLTLNHDVSNRIELERVLRTCEMKDPPTRLRGIPLRAFGDIRLKVDKAVICVPALETVEMEKGSCLLLCSDGVTDSMKDEDIGKFVRERIVKLGNMMEVAEELVKATTRKTGDDSSAVLLAFS